MGVHAGSILPLRTTEIPDKTTTAFTRYQGPDKAERIGKDTLGRGRCSRMAFHLGPVTSSYRVRGQELGLCALDWKPEGFLVGFEPERVKPVDLGSPLIVVLLFLQVT